MKILVTGSNGYIGKHLCSILSEHEVFGLDLHDRNQAPNVKKYFQTDIRKDSLNIDEEFDAVIHLAALVSVSESVKKPKDYYDTNTLGTINLLKHIYYDQFIFGSTCSAAYPENPYGVSKLVAETYVEWLASDYTIFRFYNVIGSDGYSPTNEDGLFFNLIKSLETGQIDIFGSDYDTKDGTAVRDYVHVMEICHSIKSALNNNSMKIENLGHGAGYSVEQIINCFEKTNDIILKRNYLERRDGDPAVITLNHISDYMINMYSLSDYLTVK